MKRRSLPSASREISEINMTPLIDLTFLLLITFIITFPLIEQGIPLNLPKGQTQTLEEGHTRTISLDKNGQHYWDDQPVTLEELSQAITVLSQTDPTTVVLMRADEEIAYGRVMAVLKMLNDANVSRMALVTNPEKQ